MNHDDTLSPLELQARDGYIEAGLKECRDRLCVQESPNDRMFYLGSIQGLQKCRAYDRYVRFRVELVRLERIEDRELFKAIDAPDLRAYHDLRDDERTPNMNRIWFFKGERTQIKRVYHRLMARRVATGILDKHFIDT